MAYIIPRGYWLHISVLNVHAPTGDKIDDVNCFYEELEHEFDNYFNYLMKILLDFKAKVGKEDIFKPKIWNVSLHELSNDNGVRIVNFATSKSLIVRRTIFPHRNEVKFK
jgi:hypothetical protein